LTKESWKGEEDMLIQNGMVVLFENQEIVAKKKDIRIIKDTIEAVEDSLAPKEGEKVIDATHKVVMPGLINTHAHVPMSIFRETFEGCDLYTWLQEKIWPIEDTLQPEEIYDASMLSFVEMIATGCTCVNDHYFMTEAIRKAATKAGVRAVLTRVAMGDRKEAEERLKEFDALYASRDTENTRITYAVGLHGLYTCTPETVDLVAEKARAYQLPVHMHFLETKKEVEDIQKIYGKNGAEVLSEKMQGIHVILAHGVKLQEADISLLQSLDCGIAHNPVSNLRLGCKIADTTTYLQKGLNVALGTDGQGSGSSMDMLEAMRLACLMQGGIHEEEEARLTAKQAIQMATIEGAKLLQMEDSIGSIAVGKQADIIIVNMAPSLDTITMHPYQDVISNVVYNATGRNVETTMVAGEILMENRKIPHIDVEEVMQRASGIMEKRRKSL